MNTRHPAAIRLILLPPRADAPVTCLLLDATGGVLEQRRLPAGASAPPAVGLRCVLAVPGEQVRTTRLQLPLRNPMQARAAALLQLDGELAAEQEPHIALGALEDDGHRLAAVVDEMQMRAWLARAAALGLAPDVVLPDHLLLPALADGEPASVAALDGRVLVRGPRFAFSAEAALADAVLGTQPRQAMRTGDDALGLLARGAVRPPLDLCQYAFARHPDAEGRRKRRLRVLAALLLASPLLLVAAEALRLEASRYLLLQRARALAAEVADPAQARIDPVAASDARLAQQRGDDGFNAMFAALLRAVQAQPGMRIEALDYAPGRLRAQLAHADAASLQAVNDALQATGLRSATDAGERGTDGLRSRLTLEAAP